MSNRAAAVAIEGRARYAREGSEGKRSGGKKSIEKLREERRKREAKEKERERAVLDAAGRKARQADGGWGAPIEVASWWKICSGNFI
jgi:hypothetical protein